MRNKYGKLFIEIESDGNDGYQVKEKYRQPLLDYAKSRSYKDVIVKLDNSYLNATSQIINTTDCAIRFGNITYLDTELNSYNTGEIYIVLSNETISVNYSEL